MKKIISLTLCICICFSLLTCFSSATSDISLEESIALDLKELNLFKGVSETNFDLNRAPTRVEALVMLIRVLGKEEEALASTSEHPFKDVPAWADRYVGYAYSAGLTNGVSSTEFGSGNVNCAMYLTFMLRALGYSDKNGADFTWDSPYNLASESHIFPLSVDENNFLRRDAAIISYCALSATMKNSTNTLADTLISAGVFTREKFDNVYDMLKTVSPSKYYKSLSVLRDYLVYYGEFNSSDFAGIHFEEYVITENSSSGQSTYTLSYCPITGYITASTTYYGDAATVSTSLQLAGAASSNDYIRGIFGLTSDKNSPILEAVNIHCSTYTDGTPVKFLKDLPAEQASYQWICEGWCAENICATLDFLEYTLKRLSTPLTISDFGFSSFK